MNRSIPSGLTGLSRPTGMAAGIALACALLSASASANQSDFEARAFSALALGDGVISTAAFEGAPGRDTVVSLNYGGSPLTIDLTPHSAMTDSGRLLEDRGTGELVEVNQGIIRTYRGSVRELPGSIVAGGWMDDGFYARIKQADGSDLWIQPLTGNVEGASDAQHIIYTGADILVDVANRCGGALLANASTGDALIPSGKVAQLGGGPNVAELGCDADFEFFQDHGSSSTGVMNRINLVIDTMNLQYESEVNITHDITAIIVRTTSSDPYSSTDSSALLDEFRNEWNANQVSIQRDVAHLFTGKNLQGSVIGVAYLSVICSTSSGYGLVESDFNNNLGCATDLSAHELGHNWSANHCSCTGNTMNAFITCANSFTASTSTTIVSYSNLIGCLNVGPLPPNSNFSGTPTSGVVPLTVKFGDSSNYTPTSWFWSFGDGGTSTEKSPSYTFANAGTYSVALTATNANGSDTETKVNYVAVMETTTGTCTSRNGSGLNPDIYACSSVPSIGTTWVTTIDAGSAGVNSGISFVFGFGSISAPLPTAFGEFLVDPSSGQVIFNLGIIVAGTATHSIGIANDVSLIGFPVATQGFLNQGQLLNAVDIVIGS